MQTLIFLPTQGPHLPRSGPADQADWRVQCRMAAERLRSLEDAVIYVPSAFQMTGKPHELDYYAGELRALGVAESALRLDPRGLDTVEQCELALDAARGGKAKLIAITCSTQSPRVRWLLRGHDVMHVTARGRANRWLRFSNGVLALVFPVLDVLGLREWWKARVARRRQAGLQ